VADVQTAGAAVQGGALPASLTAFIGRQRELASIREALQAARLVTLVGPGGAGKTRLAIESARLMGGTYRDGVRLVQLADVVDGRLVADAVAGALEVAEEPGQPLGRRLAGYLAGKQLLLVVDNCEHVAADCARLVRELLPASGEVRMLATSREPLHVAGEQVLAIGPLGLPEASLTDGRPSPDHVASAEAAAFFLDRARETLPGFELTADNAADVVRLCRALDGLPLALELAAARLRAFNPRQLAERLDQALHVLARGGGADPRHATMRAAIDSSYGPLPAEERAVYRRLAVFAGGWSLEACEDVCAAGDVSQAGAAAALAALVEKSLVAVETDHPAPRYRFLEPVRQHAVEQLRLCGEEPAARDRHLAWVVTLVEGAEEPLRGPGQLHWYSLIKTELANIRAALEWSRTNPADGLRAASSLMRFWYIGTHMSEGLRWLTDLIDLARSRAQPVPPDVLLKALTCAGFIAGGVRDSRAAGLLAEASELAGAQDDAAAQAFIAICIGQAAINSGADIAGAARFLEEGVRLAEAGPAPRCASFHAEALFVGLYGMALFARVRGDLDLALRLHQRGLDDAVLRDDVTQQMIVLAPLGCLLLHRGEIEHARRALADGLRMAANAAWEGGLVRSLWPAAGCAALAGSPRVAARLAGAAAALEERTGSQLTPLEIALIRGWLDAARARLGPESWNLEDAHGRRMSQGEAVAEALDSLAAAGRGEEPGPAGDEPLTLREREVLVCLARGQTNLEIADALVVSRSTVDRHIANIYAKLGVVNRSQATRYALLHGLT
jgi:predicted ATPase/DNA-binding CsgD family transcriptional regulator